MHSITKPRDITLEDYAALTLVRAGFFDLERRETRNLSAAIKKPELIGMLADKLSTPRQKRSFRLALKGVSPRDEILATMIREMYMTDNSNDLPIPARLEKTLQHLVVEGFVEGAKPFPVTYRLTSRGEQMYQEFTRLAIGFGVPAATST